jgi:mannitol/fructose-specific phosphotransferase system IIA component (Ntr-type)
MPAELPCLRAEVSRADYTRADLIVPELCASDPAGIIEELSQPLFTREIGGDMLSFYHLAMNHEFLSNSALPAGIAIPHARTSFANRLTLAIGRPRRPVVWGARGAWPVKLIFLLAVPATAARDYLVLLSAIAVLAHQPDWLHRLHAAADGREISTILQAVHLNPA